MNTAADTPMPRDLLEHTQKITRHFMYTGVGLAQFLVDRSRDATSFLELNPRFNGNTAVPERAGLECCRLSIDLAEDADRTEETIIPNGGLRHSWLFGDLNGLRNSWRQGILPASHVPGATVRALRDAITADFHVIWSMRDPMPAITQFTKLIK